MSFFQVATPYPGPPVVPETGVITAGHNVFTDEHGGIWSYRGVSQFLLFYRWLQGEDIAPVLAWSQALAANTVRVLGMCAWPGQRFGPTINGNWWAELRPFLDYVGGFGLRVEFTVFADAQVLMPDPQQQKVHLRRVLDEIGGCWNVFIEVCNEPFKNGCKPDQIFGESDPRGCSMAYGNYDPTVTQDPSGLWIATLPVLDYLTVHTPRDPDAWSRKVKDLSEYRDGSGDGSAENAPLLEGLHVAPVGDEPMGAAEQDQLAGRQRSNIPNDFFWAVANACLNGAGSTFHSDAGLQAVVPPPEGDQQKCAEASALAWSSIAPDFQAGHYTRGGLADLPLVWEPSYFPDQTSRIYARILGDLAVCVAIKPNAGWTPKATGGWTIAHAMGPMNSLVFLTR